MNSTSCKDIGRGSPNVAVLARHGLQEHAFHLGSDLVPVELGHVGARVQAVADNALLPDLRGVGNGITATGIDRRAQEDARRIAFAKGAKLTLSGPASDAGWRITYQVNARPGAPVTVTAGGKTLDITQGLSVAEGKGWREMVLGASCLGKTGERLTFASKGAFTIAISEITRTEDDAAVECSF